MTTSAPPDRIAASRAALIVYDACRRALAPADPARRAAMRPVLDAWVTLIGGGPPPGRPHISTTPGRPGGGARGALLPPRPRGPPGGPPPPHRPTGAPGAGLPAAAPPGVSGPGGGWGGAAGRGGAARGVGGGGGVIGGPPNVTISARRLPRRGEPLRGRRHARVARAQVVVRHQREVRVGQPPQLG